MKQLLAILLASLPVFDFSLLKFWQFDSYDRHHTFPDPLNSSEKDMNWNAWESSLDSITQQLQCSHWLEPKAICRASSTKLPMGFFID
jgi:hypothetical protein